MFATRPRAASTSGLLAGVLFLAPWFPAAAAEHRSPVVLRAAVTLDAGVDASTLAFSSNGIPVQFGIEMLPSGGTFELELDGDLVATWDSTQVKAGDQFTLSTTFQPDDTIGVGASAFRVYVQPYYIIDFDSLFHDPFSYWGAFSPILLGYPETGQVEGQFPAVATQVLSFAVTDPYPSASEDLFLLAGPYSRPESVLDSLDFTFDLAPRPCVRLQASGRVLVSYAYTAGMDTLCVQYDPADTLCWRSDAITGCGPTLGGTHTISVPCRGVEDFIVALCPIRAWGGVDVELRVILELDLLKLTYTCIDVSPGPIEGATGSTDTLLIDQEFEAGTDRDDAIFILPVDVGQVAVFVEDATSTLLGDGDTLFAGQDYDLSWDSLNADLLTCCSDDSVRISYRDFTADTTGVCYGAVATQVTGLNAYSWTAPSPACFDGREGRVLIEFFCPSAGTVLQRAWSSDFVFSGGGP